MTGEIPNISINGNSGAAVDKPIEKEIVKDLENAIKNSGVKLDDVKIDIQAEKASGRRTVGTAAEPRHEQTVEAAATIGGKTIKLGTIYKENINGAVQKIIACHIENQFEKKGISFISAGDDKKNITSATSKVIASGKDSNIINNYLKTINSIEGGKLPGIEIVNPNKYGNSIWAIISKAKELGGSKVLIDETGQNIDVIRLAENEYTVIIPGEMLNKADEKGLEQIKAQINTKIEEVKKQPLKEPVEANAGKTAVKSNTFVAPTATDAAVTTWERYLAMSGAEAGTIGDGHLKVSGKDVELFRNAENKLFARVKGAGVFGRDIVINLEDGLNTKEAKKLGLTQTINSLGWGKNFFKNVHRMIDGLGKKDNVITIKELEQFEKEITTYAEAVFCDEGETPDQAQIEKARNFYASHTGGWTKKSIKELRSISNTKADGFLEASKGDEEKAGVNVKKAYESFKSSIKNPVLQKYIDLLMQSSRYKKADSDEKVFKDLVSRICFLSMITGLDEDSQKDYALFLIQKHKITGDAASEAENDQNAYVFNKSNVKGEFNKAGEDLEKELNMWMGGVEVAAAEKAEKTKIDSVASLQKKAEKAEALLKEGKEDEAITIYKDILESKIPGTNETYVKQAIEMAYESKVKRLLKGDKANWDNELKPMLDDTSMIEEKKTGDITHDSIIRHMNVFFDENKQNNQKLADFLAFVQPYEQIYKAAAQVTAAYAVMYNDGNTQNAIVQDKDYASKLAKLIPIDVEVFMDKKSIKDIRSEILNDKSNSENKIIIQKMKTNIGSAKKSSPQKVTVQNNIAVYTLDALSEKLSVNPKKGKSSSYTFSAGDKPAASGVLNLEKFSIGKVSVYKVNDKEEYIIASDIKVVKGKDKKAPGKIESTGNIDLNDVLQKYVAGNTTNEQLIKALNQKIDWAKIDPVINKMTPKQKDKIGNFILAVSAQAGTTLSENINHITDLVIKL
ncbi:MAG: hypothetical protein ABIH39_07760 [Candidatus Margulisiibacteriota bacterium]